MTLDLASRYRIAGGKGFSLSAIDPADTGESGLTKASARPLLAHGLKQLIGLQERLYAERRWALLIILQGMDTSGKDGVVKHVMSGVNPLGCSAYSFQTPTRSEHDRGYLWRSQVNTPSRGHIGIFNRSYYEEVLAVRVRKRALDDEHIPLGLVTDHIWRQRFADIAAFESYLASVGIVPLKFMLHISKAEQRKRLLARADDPDKQWKFNAGDVADRRQWLAYQEAYEDVIRHTATESAPWHVVPADHKWFARLVVASVVIAALRRINPQFPGMTRDDRDALAAARSELSSGGG